MCRTIWCDGKFWKLFGFWSENKASLGMLAGRHAADDGRSTAASPNRATLAFRRCSVFENQPAEPAASPSPTPFPLQLLFSLHFALLSSASRVPATVHCRRPCRDLWNTLEKYNVEKFKKLSKPVLISRLGLFRTVDGKNKEPYVLLYPCVLNRKKRCSIQ